MASKDIIIKGAREHNLKNIDVRIPRDKLVVLTGLSGSGKSSLAFDTIYAEGQRRYVESLSSYARQFLGQMEKPNVDSIDGLSPAISIDQKTTSKNPRSTVGTVTEIYDYLRLLYARVGIPHCPICGREIARQSVDSIVDRVLSMEKGTKVQIMAPVVRGRKGEHQKELDAARRSGFVRVRVDGNLYDLSEEIKLEKNNKHNIEVVNADCREFVVENDRHFDAYYIDPARRGIANSRLFSFADCEPNVLTLLPLLLQGGSEVWLKASPMVDISLAISELAHVTDVYAISVKGECKELLFRIKAGTVSEAVIHCVDIVHGKYEIFDFLLSEEKSIASLHYAVLARYCRQCERGGKSKVCCPSFHRSGSLFLRR